MNYHHQIKKLIRKAENLERKVAYDLRKRGASPIDTYMDRCLRYAEQINDLTQVPDRQKVPARRRIFKVYFNLQDYTGIEHTQEEHLEDMMGDLDLAIVEAHSADMRTGGMGFSSANNVMMTGGLGAPKNPYWNAGNYAKAKKVVEIDTSNHVYKPKQTMVQWKEANKQEKKGVLDE
jgi:hypothetical protein